MREFRVEYKSGVSWEADKLVYIFQEGDSELL